MIKIRRKSMICFFITLLLGGFLLFTKEHIYQLLVIFIIVGMLCSLVKNVKVHNMISSLFVLGLSAVLVIADKIYDINMSNWGINYVTFLWIWTIFVVLKRQYLLFNMLEKFYPYVKVKYNRYSMISERKEKEEYLDHALRELEKNGDFPQVKDVIGKYNAIWVIITLHFEIVIFMTIYGKF